MTAASFAADRRVALAGIPRVIWWVGLLVVSTVLYLLFRGEWTIPHADETELFDALLGFRDWVEDTLRTGPIGAVLNAIRDGVGWFVELIIDLLLVMGWPAILALGATISYAVGGWRITALTGAGLVLMGAMGLWESSMETLGLTLGAVILSLLLGIPIGILAGRSDRARAAITPVLDIMQIMPTFAYLAPFALLFGIGAPAAAIVTLIYAMPAAIRITALGIRGVPESTIEAGRSLGATNRQLLRRVQLPLAAKALGLAVNQTIMLALSMVVVTVLINAPGLGADIIFALERLDVGAAFEAGLAVVLLAVILDRITEHASYRMDPRRMALRTGRGDAPWRRPILVAATGLTIILVIYGQIASGAVEDFPTDVLSISLRGPVNDIVDWMRTNLFWITDGIKEVVSLYILNPLETILTTAPFWLVIGVATVIGLLISGVRAAVVALVGLTACIALQLWEHSMETLAIVLVGTVITMLIGVTLGVFSARSDRFSSFVRPVLDFAQTMPSFVYLLPAVALFGASRFTAIVAAVIFAVPPVVRLVETGVRLVPPSIIEAARSSGTNSRQLLWKVQLPVARPAMMLALNQGIVMVLGMVVVGGLVGAGALGYDVVAGFAQREDFGKGLAAGICIVLLGVVLDRVSQGAGRRSGGESSQRAG